MGFFKFYPFQIIWAKKMHGLVVLCGSVKGLSRDHQGCIGHSLEVSMGVQLGIHCGSLEIINMS